MKRGFPLFFIGFARFFLGFVTFCYVFLWFFILVTLSSLEKVASEQRMAVAHVAAQSDEVPSVHSAKLGKNVGRAAEHRILLRKTLISCHS